MKKIEFITQSKRVSFIYAGPYARRDTTLENTLYFKLASELRLPCDVNLPILDFAVPTDDSNPMEALSIALQHLNSGGNIFIGCRGGLGRTGLFMALLFKCIGVTDPISHVRLVYSASAIETSEQEEYVNKFKVPVIYGSSPR